MINKEFTNKYETIKNMDDKAFYDNFAHIMHLALVKDELFYTDLIDLMYEIKDRDEKTWEYLANKTDLIYSLIFDKKGFEFGFSLGSVFYECYSDKFTEGECLALGCVAEGYISYIKNWLTKDEFYEIRDMFVPFCLPISVELMDVDKGVECFKADNELNEKNLYTLPLIKKIGKTVIDSTVSPEDIRAALTEINFDEAW